MIGIQYVKSVVQQIKSNKSMSSAATVEDILGTSSTSKIGKESEAIEGKLISPSKAPLTDGKYEGVQGTFLKNGRMRFFVPSTKNYFGDFQSRTCLHDTGCCSHLIGIPSLEDLQLVLDRFKPKSLELRFQFCISKGVAGTHVVMAINNKDSSPFVVNLCRDLLPNSPGIKVPTLRFYLCAEDVEHLLASNMLTFLQKEALDAIAEQVSPDTKRRNHTLVGQDILSKFAGISFGNVIILVNDSIFSPVHIWDTMGSIANDFLRPEFQSHLPTNFNNLESDDLHSSDESFSFE